LRIVCNANQDVCLLDCEHCSVHISNSKCLSQTHRLRHWIQSPSEVRLPLTQPRRNALSSYSKWWWTLLSEL